MVLPSGFALPPLPHLLALLAGAGAVAGALRRVRPAVTPGVVLAFAPWMVLGSALHALYQLGAAPGAVAPLLGAPAVYLTTFAAGGAAWLLADRVAGTARALGAAGTLALLPAVGLVVAAGSAVRPLWTAGSLLAAAALTAGAWLLLRAVDADAARATGAVGVLVVFAHALDGVSTAVGVEVFGFAERTPASRLVLEVGAALPTADLLGAGWLFVLLKLAVAGLVVSLFAGFVREEPTRAYLLLAFVAAVGLGPGAQNLLLYMAG